MPRRPLFWILAALAVLAASAQAWYLRWTCDDAYISFRYAQHFVEGHGLVFNLDPAEPPVEGYTNFAWTMWLAFGWLLGWSGDAIETWSIAWGVLCHGATVLLLARIAARASGDRARVPIAACGYAALHHAASLAPAGLETALFVLLTTGMLWLVLVLRCVRDAWLLGFVGVLAAMTRPDGAVFVVAAGAFVLFDARRRRAPALLVGYLAPFALVFAPYLLWRRAYYGQWVPNTYFAKSGPDSVLGPGLAYVVDFGVCYWPLLIAPVLVAVFLVRRPDLLAPVSVFLGRRPWAAIAAFVLPYVAFVVHAGGDFMFARFLLPVLPALLLAFDLACLRGRAPWLPWALAALLVGGLQWRLEPPRLDDYTAPVSDNRRISLAPLFGMPATEAFRRAGHELQRLFAGLDVRIAVAGGQANLAFRSRVPVAIECAGGLTDAFIAHLPIARRHKPGHDRPWPLYPEYLERRRVQFMFELSYGADDPWREVAFLGSIPARLVRYDRTLMQELRRRDPGLVATDFERFLDDYIAALPGRSKQQVAADLAKFRRFYFDHEQDPVRLAAIEASAR